MRYGLILVMVVMAAGVGYGADYWVSPEGAPDGLGTIEAPWDIATAMAQPAGVLPGDRIWLRGGLYRLERTLVSSLTGTPEAPITVRQAPGERARLDCAPAATAGDVSCLEIAGAHARYWGFEIFNSRFERSGDADPRGAGIHCRAGAGTKLINLVVHDVGLALFESQPSGLEIYGLIAYNSGWDGPDRSHGPGIYIRNRSDWPVKTIEDSIVFQHFRQGLQGYGSWANVFSRFRVVGNIFFNNGIGRDGFHRNLMFGNPNSDHRDNLFRDNYTYFSSGAGGGSNSFGVEAGCDGLTLTGNVFAHGPGRTALEIGNCTNVDVSGNLFYGGVTGAAGDGALNLAFGGTKPTGVSAFLRPNRYEPGRANLVVYNWDLAEEVLVDLKSLGIPNGAAVETRNVQDYFGEPHTIRFNGKPVAVPMTGWSAAAPIGMDGAALPPTFPEFGAFVLTWDAGHGSGRR